MPSPLPPPLHLQQTRIPTTTNTNPTFSSSTLTRRRHHLLGAGRERRLTVDLGLASAMFNSTSSSSSSPAPPLNNRCQTPTSFPNASMNGSLTLTLPRGDRPSPSPKCFGKNTHILKEDYERERIRWEKRLEEAEGKLAEAAMYNSELFQMKAELNRKIIDFEKSQAIKSKMGIHLNLLSGQICAF